MQHFVNITQNARIYARAVDRRELYSATLEQVIYLDYSHERGERLRVGHDRRRLRITCFTKPTGRCQPDKGLVSYTQDTNRFAGKDGWRLEVSI